MTKDGYLKLDKKYESATANEMNQRMKDISDEMKELTRNKTNGKISYAEWFYKINDLAQESGYIEYLRFKKFGA